jgi:beta-lactamase class D
MKIAHRITIMLAGIIGASVGSQADTPSWPQPLPAYAGDASACIAIYSESFDQYLIHNLPQCERRLAPCSTFKVPNALIGLETGVLSGPDDARTWDGTEYSRQVLNQDHDLASAIKYSVVWYFQDVALDIGPERMQAALDAYNYGNRDISGGQVHFWLDSSLEISATEQIHFMRALEQGLLPAQDENQAAVRKMMLQDYSMPDDFNGQLYGKTGSCVDGEVDHGWFTGFLRRDAKSFAFAVNVIGEGQMGWDARKIAIRVLQDMR